MDLQQPALGKRIASLRKAKGLTQEELVEKCKLSVRTLQRIEAGEVMPRSYTIKLIFTTLGEDVYGSTSPAKIRDVGPGRLQRMDITSLIFST